MVFHRTAWRATAGSSTRRLTVVLAAALCIFAPDARAQAARDSAVGRAVSSLAPNQRIRVGLLLERWTGRFDRANGDTLFLGTRDGPPMVIRFNAVDTLWRERRAYRRAAKIGAIAGTALGLAAGVAAAATCECDAGGETALWIVGYTFGGTAAGALYGLGIGALFREWKRVFP